MFKVIYYKLENGEIPVKNFIDSLPIKLQAKSLAGIALLQEKGTELRLPYSEHIKDGIFELRIKFSNDITRIFYFFIKDKKIILTNGYVKKQQKIDTAELEKALKYKKDYERRE